jgi:hypothetical protein
MIRGDVRQTTSGISNLRMRVSLLVALWRIEGLKSMRRKKTVAWDPVAHLGPEKEMAAYLGTVRPVAVAGISRPNSDWYHLKLLGTSPTPMIVRVRLMGSTCAGSVGVLNWLPSSGPTDQTVVPPVGLPSESAQVNAVPPHSWTSMAR